ncbi:MAG: hypothetical protein ABI591_00920 [Kofleriaceae bacterium]
MRLALFAVLTVAACGSEVMPSDVRARITADLGNVLRESKRTPLPGTAVLGFLSIVPTAIDPDASVKFLNERVFSDANFLGGDVYRLSPELLCPDGDTACATRIAQAGARIRVTDDDNGLYFHIQLDADHDEPIELTLTHDDLTATIDLDDADAAMIAVARGLGETAPNAVVSGQITAELNVANGRATASLSIDHPVSIAFADQAAPLDGDNAVRFTMTTGGVAIDPDGMHVTLGASTAHVPGIDLTLSPVVATLITANTLDTIVGSFDLQIATAQPQVPYSIASVMFNGSLQSSADQLQVLSGTLALATDPDPYGFLATVGQCLSAADAYDAISSTDYMQYSVVDCR